MVFAWIYWVGGRGWSDSPHFFTGSWEFTRSKRWLGLGRGVDVGCAKQIDRSNQWKEMETYKI